MRILSRAVFQVSRMEFEDICEMDKICNTIEL